MARATSKAARTTERGLVIERRFSTAGVHPYEELEWETRDAVIGNPESPAARNGRNTRSTARAGPQRSSSSRHLDTHTQTPENSISLPPTRFSIAAEPAMSSSRFMNCSSGFTDPVM